MPLQLNHQSCSNLGVTGTHHGDAFSPARPESRVPCANCASEPHTTKHEGKCGCLPHPNLALLKIDSPNLGQTPPQASVVSGRALLHSFRPDSVRSCLGTVQQKKPCGLHVSDEEVSLSRSSDTSLKCCRTKWGVTKRRVQHLDPLLRCWDLRTPPDTCSGFVLLSNPLQNVAYGRSLAILVPDFRLAIMSADAGPRLQLISKASVHCAGRVTMWMSSRKASKCSPLLSWAPTASRAECCPTENRSGMRGSPCSPPSPWRIVCAVPVASSQRYSDGDP